MTDNTMAKGQQDKQWQTIQWLKDNRTRMTDNTMVKGQQDKQWQTIKLQKDKNDR